MLSSVLNSEVAISVNIQIIRIFTKIRQALLDNTEPRLAIEKLIKTDNNTKNIELLFPYFDELTNKQEIPAKPRKAVGYNTPKVNKINAQSAIPGQHDYLNWLSG